MTEPENRDGLETQDDERAYYNTWFQHARVASTAPLDLAATAPGTPIDGVAVAVGDTVLIKDQANPVENGLYVVHQDGGLVRSPVADSEQRFPAGAIVRAAEGTQGGALWLNVSAISYDMGRDPVTFGVLEQAGGKPGKHADTHIFGEGSDPLSPIDVGAIPLALLGKPGGTATLDSKGLVRSEQIPLSTVTHTRCTKRIEIDAGKWTSIQFDHMITNASEIDYSGGYLFKVNQLGIYEVTVNLNVKGPAGTPVWLRIKNDSEVRVGPAITRVDINADDANTGINLTCTTPAKVQSSFAVEVKAPVAGVATDPGDPPAINIRRIGSWPGNL